MTPLFNKTWSELALEMRNLSTRLLSIRSSIGYSKDDARNVVLTNCCIVTTSSQLILNMFSSTESGVLGPADYEKIFDVPEQAQKEANENLEKMTRLNVLLLFQFQVENFMANLNRELGIAKQKGFYNNAKKLLDSIELNYEDKLNILNTPAYIRNSLHSNGIHNGRDVEMEINGINYKFLNEETVKCASWVHIINVLNGVVNILEEILASNKISALEEPIKDEYIWQREN